MNFLGLEFKMTSALNGAAAGVVVAAGVTGQQVYIVSYLVNSNNSAATCAFHFESNGVKITPRIQLTSTINNTSNSYSCGPSQAYICVGSSGNDVTLVADDGITKDLNVGYYQF